MPLSSRSDGAGHRLQAAQQRGPFLVLAQVTTGAGEFVLFKSDRAANSRHQSRLSMA